MNKGLGVVPMAAVLMLMGNVLANQSRTDKDAQTKSAPKAAAKAGTSTGVAGHPAFGDGQRDWRFTEMALWVEWLRQPGILVPHAIETIAANPLHNQVSTDFLQAIFQPDTLNKLLASFDDNPTALLQWWQSGLAPDFRKRARFPADIARRRGPQALRQAPQIVVGTIHSVKGGQADVVYLFPDLSKAGDAQYRKSGPSRDSVIRTFYVGATRARETLYICAPEGPAVAI